MGRHVGRHVAEISNLAVSLTIDDAGMDGAALWRADAWDVR